VDDLRKAINTLWRCGYGFMEKSSEDNEFVLNVFGGFCFNCNQKGHKSHEYPANKMEKSEEYAYSGMQV
jgi:hypothetical protein